MLESLSDTALAEVTWDDHLCKCQCREYKLVLKVPVGPADKSVINPCG